MSTLEHAPNHIESTDDITTQIERLQQEYQALEKRHKILDSVVPHWDECIGVIQEMTRMEEAMKSIRERLTQLKTQCEVA